MDQIERISHMEQALDAVSGALDGLASAVESYTAALGQMQALFIYYFGPEWRVDFSDDSAGRLPQDLKRGVLSEDAVYNLFVKNRELLAQLRMLVSDKKYPDL